jgi:hypothetical protein
MQNVIANQHLRSGRTHAVAGLPLVSNWYRCLSCDSESSLTAFFCSHRTATARWSWRSSSPARAKRERGRGRGCGWARAVAGAGQLRVLRPARSASTRPWPASTRPWPASAARLQGGLQRTVFIVDAKAGSIGAGAPLGPRGRSWRRACPATQTSLQNTPCRTGLLASAPPLQLPRTRFC